MTSEIKYYAKDLKGSRAKNAFSVEYFIELEDSFISIKAEDMNPLKTLGELVNPIYTESLFSTKQPLINYEDKTKGIRKLTWREELILLGTLKNKNDFLNCNYMKN